MSDPRTVCLREVEWVEEVPGIWVRAITVERSRWALVRYVPGAWRPEWCDEGHRGYVIEGEIEYEFDEGVTAIKAVTGDAFLLLGGVPHRGRNLAPGSTTIFLIDDPIQGQVPSQPDR